MIKIFDATDTDFSTAGNISIDPLKCIETKKKSLNGWYIDVELSIKYKEYIKKDKLCVVKTKSKLKPQAFRISEDIQYSTRRIKFKAEHVMFDSRDYFLLDARPTNQNGMNGLNYINVRTDNVSPFTIYSNVETINTAYFIRKNLLEAWTIFEERWRGIFDADNWDISFLQSVGNDNGETITYGKDMQGFDIYEDWSGVVTRLYPVGYDGIMLPENFLESDIQYEKPYTRTIDFQTNLEQEEQTEAKLLAELRENAQSYLDENKVPKISYTISSNINNKLEIGDTIKVLHPFVNIFTEVLEYEYDLISEKVKSLTFGNYTRDVKTKFNNIKNTIETIKQTVSKQEITIKEQTNLINSLNKNGYVYIDDNEILILDALPKESAKNVWRFGLAGIGFSSNGFEGPFEIAMTMDGKINADFITTGTMAVDRIESLANFITDTSASIAAIELQQDNITTKVSSVEQLVENITNTAGEATGKNIHLEDSSDEPLVSIKVKGETSQETRSGKNYFNANKIANSQIIVSDNGKTITMPIATSGNGYTSTNRKLSELCPNLKVGDTVYLLGDTTSQINKYIYLEGNSKTTWVLGKPRTLTENDLNAAFIIYGNNFNKGETERVTISNLRIVKNASDEWEQYGASPSPDYPSPIENITGNIEIKYEGKNLVKQINWKQLPSVSTGATTTSVNGYGTDYIEVDNTKQYIFSYLGTAGSRYITYYDRDKNFLGYDINLQINNFAKWSETGYVRLRVDCSQDSVTDFQLEIGLEATDYEPYKSQVVTFPLGKEKLMEGSYLADDGIHHTRKQVVLDGTETGWYTLANQTGTNTSYFCISKNDMKKASTLICDKFINRDVWNTDEEAIQNIIDNYIRLRINTSRASTVAELKTWLSNNPIRVEYELESEEIVPYTTEQQIAWNKIKKLYTYKNVTNIFSDAELDIVYIRDNGLSDMYETKQNASKNYTKTSTEIQQLDDSIKRTISQIGDRSQKTTTVTEDIDGIKNEVSKIQDLTQTTSGTKTIVLSNCAKGNLLKLQIKGNNTVFKYLYPSDNLYPSDDLYPYGDSRILVNDIQYELGVLDTLRQNGEVYDEFVLENGQAKVIRRINTDGTVKTEEMAEDLGKLSISLNNGTNIIKILNYSAEIIAKYATKNNYTDIFATKVEMSSSIEQTAEGINQVVRKKVDGDEIISKINQSAEEMEIDANKININGVVSANGNFKVDTERKYEM